MIGFTSDIDWAPEAVIEDMLSLFTSYNVKCTLFCTHDSQVIKNCDRNLFELGVHPNYNSLIAGNPSASPEEILQQIISIYPEARGVRSHSLAYHSSFLEMYRTNKILYQANQFLPYCEQLYPYKMWNGLYSIPYNWEDDVHWAYNNSFNNALINFERPGIKVFDFHPMHVFLNTDCADTYAKAKPYYQDAEQLQQYRNTTVPGTRDLLIQLLQRMQQEGHQTFTQLEILENYERNNKQ